MKIKIIKDYWHNGNIYTERHLLNRKYHREDGPAFISYYEKGNIQYVHYYLNNKFHREDGPAIVYYNHNGDIIAQYYYINDKELTKSEWLIHCRKRKLKKI